MKRRRGFLVLLLLLLVTVLFMLPAVHWRLIGWARGEAFYQGMPASWWANEIEVSYHGIWGSGSVKIVGEPIWYVETQSSFWERFRQQWLSGPAQFPPVIGKSPLLEGDPAALPILLQLLRYQPAKARRVAVSGLLAQGGEKPGVFAALQDAANDADELVREDARQALARQGRVR